VVAAAAIVGPVALVRCVNEPDDEDRRECLGAVGERRYGPEFDQEDFQTNFRNISNPNRYFPLTIGSRWELQGAGEVIKLEILNRTKRIDDVTCVVLRDLVPWARQVGRRRRTRSIADPAIVARGGGLRTRGQCPGRFRRSS
jgi:hypothetical protein